jgi:predicted transcriptional regulator
MNIKKHLDMMMEIFQDSESHSFEEVRNRISMGENELNEVLDFLMEQNFIKKNEKNLKITPLGLKLLDLPSYDQSFPRTLQSLSIS